MKNMEEPIRLDFSVNHGDPINELKYHCYSESGKEIDYMVWPVLLLKGEVLQKGPIGIMTIKVIKRFSFDCRKLAG